MTIQELFVRSNEELMKVVNQIRDDQWEIEMPKGMTSKPATLRQSVNDHAYDDAWVPDVLSGKSIGAVGDAYGKILSALNTKEIYTKYNALAINAVKNYNDEDLNKIVHLSYGDFAAKDYLQHIISYRAFRIHDIAVLIGANTKMADDLVQGLWGEYSPVIESYRQMGVFPPAIDVSKDADLQTRLLALVGRM